MRGDSVKQKKNHKIVIHVDAVILQNLIHVQHGNGQVVQQVVEAVVHNIKLEHVH